MSAAPGTGNPEARKLKGVGKVLGSVATNGTGFPMPNLVWPIVACFTQATASAIRSASTASDNGADGPSMPRARMSISTDTAGSFWAEGSRAK